MIKQDAHGHAALDSVFKHLEERFGGRVHRKDVVLDMYERLCSVDRVGNRPDRAVVVGEQFGPIAADDGKITQILRQSYRLKKLRRQVGVSWIAAVAPRPCIRSWTLVIAAYSAVGSGRA